jgi:hypothetical protein
MKIDKKFKNQDLKEMIKTQVTYDFRKGIFKFGHKF